MSRRERHQPVATDSLPRRSGLATNPLFMFKHYILIALRSLRKRKGYSFLNIAGLTVGMAAGILILLAVRHDLSYDRFHEKADRIYRVVTIDSAFGVSSQRVGMTIPALAPAAEAAFPEIEAAVRLVGGGQQLFSVGERDIYAEAVFLADSTFFRVFDFELLVGHAPTALVEPNTIVLTESMAHRLFGDADPMGQTVRSNQQDDFRVTGIVADPPPNSHLVFDAIASLYPTDSEADGGFANWLQSWTGIGMIGYFLLDSPESAAALEPKLEALLREREVNPVWSVALQPLTDIHLRSTDVVFDVNAGKSDISYVWGLGLVGLFVLLIAAFNFMNLSTARSADRAREVGVRKVSGAETGQLVAQHLGESLVTGMIAFVLALGLVALMLPILAATFDRQLGLYLLADPVAILGLLGLAVVISLLAGSYPAFVLSRFDPLIVLKGSFQRSTRGEALRKGLVVTQFAASVVMIVGTLVVTQQLDHIMERNMGYNRDQVVALSVGGQNLQAQAPALREELERMPAVTGVARSNTLPGRGLGRLGLQPEGTAEEDVWITSVIVIDHDWLDLLEVELAAGRNFSLEYGTDQQEAIIINEATARELGWDDPVGRRIQAAGQNRAVVGVVKDFHFASVRHRVEPLVMLYNPNGGSTMSIRLAATDVRQALDTIEETWTRLYPDYPFEYSFLSDEFAELYREEAHFAVLSRGFAWLAIFIACLGLFGLAAFTAQQRTKEIGVRKVLGASTPRLVALMSRDFLLLVGIAFVIAVPIAYWAMGRWLEDFAYRITLGPGIFLLAGGAALAIALLTVGYHAVRAATADPVKAIRAE
jgi:putative ABC transport system permease protein